MTCLPSLLGQSTARNSSASRLAGIAAAPVAAQSKASGNGDGLGEFRKKVNARYQSARNGSIEMSIPSSCKAGDVIVAKVVIQRAPEGSDGLVTAANSSMGGAATLLKVDDEMAVKLAAAESGAVEIQADNSQPQPAIRRIFAGGRTEWTWHIKALQPGEKHLIVTSDVVYRRNFLSYDPPIIYFNSSTKSLSIQVLP
jgi:hypothetical protein